MTGTQFFIFLFQACHTVVSGQSSHSLNLRWWRDGAQNTLSCLQTRRVCFGFNKFSLTFLETISDCSDQTIVVRGGQANLPSESGSRTKTDIYNFLSVTITVSCVHLEISNYNKNLPKLAPRPLLGSSFISGCEISSYSLFHRVQYWAYSASSYAQVQGILIKLQMGEIWDMRSNTRIY